MEYQKMINFLENTPNQPSKTYNKNSVAVNVELSGTYNFNSQVKCKTSVLSSSLCYYSDVYILVSVTILVSPKYSKNRPK